MRLTIAERLRPFSHLPGTYCLLPASSLALKIFPALIILEDLQVGMPKQLVAIDLQIKGPLKNFLVIQDLEKGNVRVEGKSENGFIRYLCRIDSQKNFQIRIEKSPEEGIVSNFLNRTLKSSDCIEIGCGEAIGFIQTDEKERLSLGCHKKQEWELIKRRLSMEEIFPLWFSLGQWIPSLPLIEKKGMFHFLAECEEAIHAKKPEGILPVFEKLFLAGFEGIFVPHLHDSLHQGFAPTESNPNFEGSSLPLLTIGKELIRSLFIKEEKEGIHFLPALPPQFHSGRMTGIVISKVGKIDFEWSKKLLRRIIFHSSETKEVNFHFQPALKTFRLRESGELKGRRVKCGDFFLTTSNSIYYLDNFEK